MVFSATTDTYTGGVVFVAGVSFSGTGLTAGDTFELTDTAGDTIFGQYRVEGTTDNADFWNGRPSKMYVGLKVKSGSLANGGTWSATVITE